MKKDYKKIKKVMVILAAIFFAITVIDFGFLSSQEKKSKVRGIRLATPGVSAMNYFPFVFGSNQGFYQKEGLSVEIIAMRTALAPAALKAGNVEYQAGEIVGEAASGLPFKVIYVVANRQPHSLMARPEIKSFANLKGKTIGIGTIGSTVYHAARKMAKHFGLDPDKDITLIDVVESIRLQALLSGSIDAAMLVPPRTYLAKKRGFTELARSRDLFEAVSAAMGTTEKRLRENRNEAKAMVKGTFRSHLYIKGNRDKIIDYLIKNWGIERDMAIEAYDVGINTYTTDGSVSNSAIQNQIEETKLTGFKVRDDVTPSMITDFSLLSEVKKELSINP